MFKKRRERKQAKLHAELARALRDPDAAVRATAASDAAVSANLAWALPELAAAVAREPWTDDFHETVVDGFAVALRRDAALRERTERIFSGHLEDPEGFVRAWTGFVAELGGPPAPPETGEDLCDDMRERLTYLRDEGWRPEGIDGLGRPGTFLRDLAFDLAVMLASLVVLRNEPLSAEESEQVRDETRAILEKALTFPPDSTERLVLIAPLGDEPDDESWKDRARHGAQVDETLTLCMSTDDDRMALGVETLHHQIMRDDVLRRRRTRTVLDHLLAREQTPFVLYQVLGCYARLHLVSGLPDPPVELFLTRMRDTDVDVRSSAAAGLGIIAPGTPKETEAVAALVKRLDHDSDAEVRAAAAHSLTGLSRAEEPGARAVADALARHAASPVPEIRAASLRHAMEHGAPDAYDRLLSELDSADVHWQFLASSELALTGTNVSLPEEARLPLLERLERLAASGWAACHVDPDDGFPDADDRAEMLNDLLERVRASG